MSKLVKYKINKISELDFQRTEKDESFFIPGDDCEVSITFNIKFSPKDEQFSLVYDIVYTDKRSRERLLYSKVEVDFGIWKFEETFNLRDNTNIDVPEEFFGQAIGLSLGAARGMLVIRNQNSYLSDIYLPIFNPMTIIETYKQKLAKKQITNP